VPRKSHITRLAPEERSYIERLLREDRLTLSEMIAAVRTKFPDAPVSKSGLHRYQLSMREVTERMRAQDQVARALVDELGENPDDRAGALLVQAVTTATTDIALRMNEGQETTIDDVRKLARAAKDAIQARTTSLKERQAIEQAARERLLREQKEKLDTVFRKRGTTADVANEIRRALGVAV
jgi:short-subunit dehydrogenase involved in D-alanine esterification of teichoic acids